MLDLVFPLDFERLAEFRLLCEALRCKLHLPPEKTLRAIAREATFIYTRLYVELGYLAQVTNRPGYLTRDGVTLFESSLEVLADGHHEDCPPTKLLTDCRVLAPARDGEFFCERFARLNAHLSGDYKSGVERGAANSAIVRAQKQLAREALQQTMLLPPEFYKRRDGSTMNDAESRQAILLIKNLDRCLKLPPRQTRQFTESLVMEAGEVVARHSEKELMQFYSWLRNSRENPALPRTTERILAGFDEFFGASGASHYEETN
jgi:hypothetical protein